jgi:hypothetical protein
LQVQVLNIAYAAAGLPLAPQADPGDDLLDVVVVEERHRAEMVGWLEEPEPRGRPARDSAVWAQGQSYILRCAVAPR